MKIEQNSCVIVKFNAILGVLTIYANQAKKLGKEHLSDLKNSPFFLAHHVHTTKLTAILAVC